MTDREQGVNRGRFQTGQSGNPRGRPRLAGDFRMRCQDLMSKSGWKALEEMATNHKSPHHFRALELVVAYAYGRPTQPISGEPDDDMPPVRVTVTFDRNADKDTPSA